MDKHINLLASVIKEAQENSGPGKNTSSIKPWFGIPQISQSVCVRAGNWIEDFFNKEIELLEQSNLAELQIIKGGKRGVFAEGKERQIDIFGRSITQLLTTLEMKTNTSLDREKIDAIREHGPVKKTALEQLFNETVQSFVFDPFSFEDCDHPKVGRIVGYQTFFHWFPIGLTYDEFWSLGKHPLVQQYAFMYE